MTALDVQVKWLGRVPYEPTWRAMQSFTDERGAATPGAAAQGAIAQRDACEEPGSGGEEQHGEEQHERIDARATRAR